MSRKRTNKGHPYGHGGAFAISFLFQAKTHFSRFLTLYSLLISDLFFYLHHYPIYDVDVAIMLLLVISGAFFFSFGFANPKKDDATFECTFLIIGRFFIPDLFPCEIALVIALIFPFLFDWEALQKKRGVFFFFLSLIGKIKEEKIATILSKEKGSLAAIYFPVLYIRNPLYFSPSLELDRGIWTITAQILVLRLLTPIMEERGESQKEDKGKDNEDKKAQSPLDPYTLLRLITKFSSFLFVQRNLLSFLMKMLMLIIISKSVDVAFCMDLDSAGSVAEAIPDEAGPSAGAPSPEVLDKTKAILRAHESITSQIRELRQQQGIHVPVGERFTEMLEEKYGGEHMPEIAEHIKQYGTSSRYYKETSGFVNELKEALLRKTRQDKT